LGQPGFSEARTEIGVPKPRPESLGKTIPCFAGSLTFDATNQRTIVLGHDPGRVLTLWAFDAIADTWTKLPLANPPSGVSAGMGEYGHLHYDSGTASLFFLGAHNGNAWSGGSAGNVNLWQITLEVGNPPPTHVRQDASDSRVRPGDLEPAPE
jgi:hypothetical protein